MSLTLDLPFRSLLHSRSPSVTLFAPNDATFSHSGQPPLNLLPLYFSRRSLKSFPSGAKIAALLSDRTLTVTNVSVTASPIFDDWSLIIFGIKRFLDPYFQISDWKLHPREPRLLGPQGEPRSEDGAQRRFRRAEIQGVLCHGVVS
ncbi:hypothetical protein ACFX2I_020520 [Malus domestica]